jgi:hypothetical protein
MASAIASSAPHAAVAGCESCVRFIDDPIELEKLFSGIGALSSAFGSTRGSAGVCELDATLRDPAPACADFRLRTRRGGAR